SRQRAARAARPAAPAGPRRRRHRGLSAARRVGRRARGRLLIPMHTHHSLARLSGDSSMFSTIRAFGRRSLPLVAALATLATAACGGGDNGDSTGPGPGPTSEATVTV